MKISLFGLGYVGVVSSACLAKEGHKVIGVDINPLKVEMINNGKSPIIEEQIGELIEATVKSGNLSATNDVKEAVFSTEVSMVCVGTPSMKNGNLDLQYVRRVCEQIGEALKSKKGFHTVVIRSTVLPGTTEDILIPILEKESGKKVYGDFTVCFNPEFLREASSVYDFYHPPYTLVGEGDEKAGNVVKEIYSSLDAPFLRDSIKVAEMVKYVNNSFHGLKVAFANEIGLVCNRLKIDGHKVMEIFCMDDKLNLSAYYLKPGFAFGGSCLPKDLRAILYKSKELDLELPVMQSIMKSNYSQIEQGIDMILSTKKKKVGILGLSFKAGTDDLRESPLVILVETLIGKGLKVKIYDQSVSLAKLFGSNKEYIEKEIPHISELMCSDLKELVESSEVIVIGNKAKKFEEAIKMNLKDKIIIDLVRISQDTQSLGKNYRGIGW
ncbi:MAG: UDP-glucose/GDP-mannose dehydrogenase family protein [candidate division Zixibacteria bacterium]|nr:UDP-glucose/GDP-mannose dehydrogenase family protein [candidate division Zixibacteria bacterium]